ncbi:MAG TPA: glycosyltransferase family 9 protein [Gemmatimonadaceae bacterium]
MAPPCRVLLIQIRRFGDVVLSTALLEDVHRAHPAARIDFLVGPEAAPLLAGHPLLHERLVLDVRRRAAMWREVRSRRYDLVVDVQGSLRTAMVTRASGAPVRVGWRRGDWRLWYTHALARGGPPEYAVRERQRLLELAGIPPGASRPRIRLASAERAEGERIARAAGAPPDGARVGLLLSTREPAKDWPAESFGALARSLAAAGLVPMVFQTPGDEARVAAVRAAHPEVVIVPPLALRRFLGALATCRVLVSGDTGPAHMADALGVARVTIFGPTSPVAWCPDLPTVVPVTGPGSRVVRLRHRARLLAAGHDFTGGIDPAVVMERVRRVLG